MIAIRGAGSAIADRLHDLLPRDEVVQAVARDVDMPLDADRYLFCSGVLHHKRKADQTREEIELSNRVNLWQVTDDCERIFSSNERARVCVIGSESAYTGSFDDTYAAAKLALHLYVKTKRLKPEQQLVCVAPSIISDAGMTMRRQDIHNLILRLRDHPKRRFLAAIEVARLVHFALYVDLGYLTNVVIRLNGGSHA